MSDLVVSVRLNADGSGLVGQLKVSREEMALLRVEEGKVAAAARDMAAATGAAADAQAQASAKVRGAAQAVEDHTRATGKNVASLGAQRAGYQQVGFQLQDTIVQYQMGTNAMTILTQQGGALLQGLSLLGGGVDASKGKFAAFVNFLGGPGGAALAIGVTLVGALTSAFLKNADAADAAKIGSSGLAEAQSVLGDVFELANGKLKSQNELLRLNARLTALNLRADALKEGRTAAETFADVGQPGVFSFGPSRVTGPVQRRLLEGIQSGKITREQGLQQSEKLDFSGLGVSKQEFQQAIIDSASSTAKKKIADLIDKSLDTNTLDPVFRRETKPKKDNSAEKAAREAERLATFGERAEDAMARLNDQFNIAPKDIDRVRQATDQLDDVVRDLEKRKPPNYLALIEQAKALRPLIEDSLARPIRDMIEDQERELEIGNLRLQGREADAQALQLTYSLMGKMGAENEAQLAAMLAQRGIRGEEVQQLYDNLDAMRQQTREMEAQHQIQQAFVGVLGETRENIRQTLADLRKDGPKAIGDMFKRLLDTADNLFAEVLTEKLFGGLFRDLEDQVTGADKVSRAGNKMAAAVDKAAVSIGKLGDAADKASGGVGGAGGTAGGGVAGIVAGDGLPIGDDEIVVTGKRLLDGLKDGFKAGYEEVIEGVTDGIDSVFKSIFGDRGLFDGTLSKSLGRAFGGAQLGATVGKGVTDALGVKGSSTGGALGGAAGSFLEKPLNSLLNGLGPLGSIAGGIVGSLVGGLFKKTKTGSATITGGDEENVSLSGNNSARKQASSGLAGSVQDTLKQLADEFGGSIGKFAVSIGIRDKDFRVDTTGQGKTKVKKGAVDFGDDEAGAIAFAVMNAIADGGLAGISAAVQKALRSSPDLDDAIEEALKVREVEEALDGIGGELERQFKEFEKQARERVRIATQYGFDVTAIEKKNAEDRAKIVDQILAERVGSLQNLLDDLKYGDLFEGSASDQRDALVAQVAKARSEAEAGVDGAADRLADLSRKLIELSRDSFGTAGGEYAADRTSAVAGAESVIKAENARLKAAQDAAQAANAKLDTGNRLANEANDLLASINSRLQYWRPATATTPAVDYGGYMRNSKI